MALNDKVEIQQFGLTMNNAYFKIVDFTGNKDKMTIVVGVFPSLEDSKKTILKPNESGELINTGQRVNPVAVYTYPFKLDLNSADNIYIQGYNYLKSLEDFANAVDC